MAAHDVMPDIELFQPTRLEDALALLDRYRHEGWPLGGGQDTYGWLKDRAKRPQALIDLNGLDELKGIRELADGIEIGAVTTLTELMADRIVNRDWSLLAQAAARVASPQIRNAGTLGGNLVQDARCWYYRRGLSCYRAGGNLCYADTPRGMNREHALFGASRCVAVSPSDTATALAALDATMVAVSSGGERRIPARKFFVGPATHITRMTSLEPGEILAAVHLPARWAGKRFYFEKVADRNVWDFALVSIAAALAVEGGAVTDARIVIGGVSCRPHRLRVIEDALRGESLSPETAEKLAPLAVRGARPLNCNQFKVPLMQNLVRRALRS